MTRKDTILDIARDSGIIQPEDLLRLLETAPDKIKLVDASYQSNPTLPKIGNAVIFDIDDIADPYSPMAHMLPNADLFAQKVGALGIGNDDFVITYDQSGIVMAASRAWWMFRVFGHDNVAVLDGGLIGWVRKNYPVAEEPARPQPKPFKATFRPELVLNYEQMKSISDNKSATILDARPPERFIDNIPNSENMPALSLMGADRHLKPAERDFAPDSKIVTTCGSGVTACVIALALFQKGHKNVPVYDGSWTEWSSK